MYGHIKQLAEAEKAGLKKAGIEADVYQVAETLPQEVLTKVHTPLPPPIPSLSNTPVNRCTPHQKIPKSP